MSLFHHGPDDVAVPSTVVTPQLRSGPAAVSVPASADASNDAIEYEEMYEEMHEEEYEEEEYEERYEQEYEQDYEEDNEEDDEDETDGAIAADKDAYEQDEAVSIRFSLPSAARSREDDDRSAYRIGIYMRMANPQGGALAPVVSLPLCPARDGCAASGTVTFEPDSVTLMGEGGGWPLDLLEWGTGFDAYVLDGSGEDLVGPVQFNIMMDDTY
jgi:hypothetical protein